MSQESSGSELEIAKEYSVVLADTDDEDDRYLDAFCESIKRATEHRKTSGFSMASRARGRESPVSGRVFAAAEEAACLDTDKTVLSDKRGTKEPEAPPETRKRGFCGVMASWASPRKP